jgi:hypothetical protein
MASIDKINQKWLKYEPARRWYLATILYGVTAQNNVHVYYGI